LAIAFCGVGALIRLAGPLGLNKGLVWFASPLALGHALPNRIVILGAFPDQP